ncbi:hypothetical protein MRX96_015292 [Rhipicephalus microplus]
MTLPAELVLLNLVCIATAVLWHHLRRCENIRIPPDPEYDYIVVGAGTAGSVVARRLLDNAVGADGEPARVLLIEAGRGEAPWYASVPLLSMALQGTSIDWHFMTAPQKDGLRCYNNQSLRLPRGKALGGSSNLYCMIHSRPTAEDWEEWNRRCQTCGLQAERVAALYRKLEFLVSDEHADRMPDAKIPVMENLCNTSEICSALRQAAAEVGLGLEKEENWMQQSNVYKGRKWTTYDLYIKPVLTNPRLRIMTGAHVSKIPVISELTGVGRNLQDHATVPIYVNLKAPVSINEYKIKSVWQIWKYIWGEGHLTSNAVASVLRTNVKDRHLQAMFIAMNFGSFREDILVKISNLKKEDMNALFPDIGKNDKEGFLLLAACLHPKSKGSVTLKTGNALDALLIDPQYFNDPQDIQCVTNAMKTALSLVSDKATSHLGASAHLPKLQYCRHFEASAENDDFLECWARMAASSLHHPVGTVAMGEASDPSAVVDGHFRVRGVERLRVVDASVIPFALSSTPHSVVMLLAERAAEIISRS